MKHKIILNTIVGSQAYGTSTPTSDIDYKKIYVQHPDEILADKYVGQINESKDIADFEVCKFINLLASANPTVLELIYMPNDCIQYKHPAFKIIEQEREKFLTKRCMDSYCRYAASQIRKASGQDKKMNWEKSKIERKGPLEFCYAYENGKTKPILKFLEERNMKQENCGLVALDHMRDCYALYYAEGAGYRGIAVDDGNFVRLTSIPKGERALCVMCFNKDGYSKHCKDYKEYQDYIQNRNPQRYVDTVKHGQQIDGKNLMHCVRLIETAEEIARYKTINIRRPNAQELLKIRRGEVSLEDLIKHSEAKMEEVKKLFEVSDLPNEVDQDLIHDLILKVRKAVIWD